MSSTNMQEHRKGIIAVPMFLRRGEYETIKDKIHLHLITIMFVFNVQN